MISTSATITVLITCDGPGCKASFVRPVNIWDCTALPADEVARIMADLRALAAERGWTCRKLAGKPADLCLECHHKALAGEFTL